MSNESEKNKFWFEDVGIIFQQMNRFYPTYQMTLVEKLNAIMRLSLYIGLVLTLVSRNYLYLYVPVVIGLFTWFIYNNQRENIEKFFAEYDYKNCDTDKPCVKPTVENPFMNFNLITDARDRPPACRSYNNTEIQHEIEDKFNYNLYRDVGDLYSKNNSQREYYTMPSTKVVSDQTSYAKWLYGQGPTCKEEGIKCAPDWSPIETDQIFERYVNPS